MLISKENKMITLINVFETRPEQQQAFIEHWIRFVDSVKGDIEMLATALHKSTDGTRVVNYGQWKAEEDLVRFQQQYRASMDALGPFAERIDPHVYEVVYFYERKEEG